jgi:XTP/dITP diphosphohydrolase
MRDMLEHLPIQVLSAKDFNLTAPEETGRTFLENALLKARYAAERVGYPVVADDSGLVVTALNGDPGIYSARYAGMGASSTDCMNKLLRQLQHVNDRDAFFYSAVVLMRHSSDPMPMIGQGLWKGRILTQPSGTHGLGYDPIFYVPTHDCSAAELEPDVKNKLSHRYQAFQQLMQSMKMHAGCLA